MDPEEGKDTRPDDRSDSRPDNRQDDRPDVWMSLKELAEARGVSIDSAARLVRRRRWRRQPGNDGRVRVSVPVGEADIRPDDRRRARPDIRADETDMARAIFALESAIASLTARAEAAEGRADRAEQGRDVLRLDLDRLRGQLEQVRREAREAQEAAERFQRADVARRTGGLLRRVWRAARGE